MAVELLRVVQTVLGGGISKPEHFFLNYGSV